MIKRDTSYDKKAINGSGVVNPDNMRAAAQTIWEKIQFWAGN